MNDEAVQELLMRFERLRDDDPQFRAAQPDLAVAASITRPDIGLGELVRVVCESYAERPALGQRVRWLVDDPRAERVVTKLTRSYYTINYGQLWYQANALARALADAGIGAGMRVATLGAPDIDYVVVDLAVVLLDAVAVPLPISASSEALRPIIEETRPTVLACGVDYLAEAARLCQASQGISTVLVFDLGPEVHERREIAEAAHRRITVRNGIRVEALHDLVATGESSSTKLTPAGDPERLALVIYTSGTSGSPKGAMHSERLVAGAWRQAAAVMVAAGFAVPAITLNYLPMSHIGGRNMLFPTLGLGGTANFVTRPDLSTFTEDLALIRPTQLNFVPRLWELVYSEYRRASARDGGRVAEFRERVLGGRYLSALTGSAPLSPDLTTKVEALLGLHLIDGLGATESGPVVVDGRVQRPPVIDYKLIDIPQLGYSSNDRPHPRGELAIKSDTMFVGYYGRPDLTVDVFDEHGFYRTGDIVEELEPDRLRYVDRRNNVIKLAQGEFVAIAALETVYGDCASVEQIYIHGDSTKPYLVAVVVPTADAIATFERGELRSAIGAQVRDAGRLAGLQKYEFLRDFVVELQPFTVANGLLTGVGKLARPVLVERYRDQLERLHTDIAQSGDAELEDLRVHGRAHPTVTTIRRAAAALLGSSGGLPEPGAHFADLGGDSLSALSFSNLIGEIYGVDLPVGVIVNPVNDLNALARYVAAERTRAAPRVTAASVHGAGSAELRAEDLSLSAFIDAQTLRTASSLTLLRQQVRSVLLTGGTGFLGRYLTLDWLQTMRSVGGRLICLVRAEDDDSAYCRLERGFDTGDERLLNRFRDLAADHLVVIAGDKSEPQLGIDRAVWNRLAEDVDTIVDAGALVNHVLPYGQLFAPNVAGTAELIRLALTARRKRMSYVSTIGVYAPMAADGSAEDADIRTACPVRRVDGSYANGYANSKWAAEVLLREAHQAYNLPVTVYRCGMLMAAGDHAGQLNTADMLTRLLFSVLVTGLAPWSFYELDASGHRQRAHFDGLPVDFVSEAIATITLRHHAGHATFHVLNPHDDGLGLDQYVDWLEESGCGIERIVDYDTWYDRFRRALLDLPEKPRAQSLLPLLDTYRYPQPALRGTFAPTDRFRDEVRNAQLGCAGAIPHVRVAEVVKYRTDLQQLGLL